ncbi:MAG TPA: hydrogenase expression/formation protein HypE [Symbiobacteriaceae bacterium]
MSGKLQPLRESHVLLGHGSGGKMSAELVQSVFLPAFHNPVLAALNDQAVVTVEGARLAFTTDSFVVSPPFFPGGDIGCLAVNGTVNDLVVGGAVPICLSASFIVEEGFPVADLRRVAQSMAAAAEAAGVQIVTGDTKVVERGAADGLFITTAGVGLVPAGRDLGPHRIQPGDLILCSGTVGDHGVAILSLRNGLQFDVPIESDSAALGGLVEAMLAAGGEGIHAMRDPTRGGVAASLNEWAMATGTQIVVEEAAIPLRDEVRAVCELLGIDPLNVANEGKLLAAVAPDVAEAVLAAMRTHPLGRQAAVVGEVRAGEAGTVFLRTQVGGTRPLEYPSGEQLPRIC